MTIGLLQFFSTAGSFSTLAQSFGTNLNEVWSTTLENTGYVGASFRAKRADNNNQFDVPFSGKYADPTAASNFSGTTALLVKVYGQVNGLDATAMSGSATVAFIDTDGRWSFGNTSTPTTNSPGLSVADNTLLKPTNPHLFMLTNCGKVSGGAPPYSGQGLLVEYGGTGLFYNVGRYGFGFGIQNGFGFDSCQNGSSPGAGFEGTYQNTLGEAHVDTWHVWDHSPSTLETRFDAGFYEINTAGTNTSITYPTSHQLNLMSDFDGNTPYQGSWRLIALYGATQTTTVRNQISNFLLTDGTTVTPLPLSFTDTDGFTYSPKYFPTGVASSADLFGLSWSDENGGYEWPSFGKATNLSNSSSANLVRLALQTGDSDVVITGAQRCERGAYGNSFAPGQNGAMFAQFYIEPGSAMIGTGDNFATIFQVHYLAGASPDVCTMSVVGENFQTFTNRNGGGNTIQGTSVPIVRGVWWAILYRMAWSAGGTTDALQVYLGQNGGSLTKIADVSGSLFSTDSPTGAYPKQGIYTGDPGVNPNFAIRVANQQFSTTLSAFDSFITSQPALPTHT